MGATGAGYGIGPRERATGTGHGSGPQEWATLTVKISEVEEYVNHFCLAMTSCIALG